MIICDSSIIKLPKITDHRGSLSFIEGCHHIDFDIKRVYYLYNIPSEGVRGAHGHKNLRQLLIPLSGSFEVTLDDGKNRKKYQLNDPSMGLYIKPMFWRELTKFSTDAVCLVLASECYDETDYFRDYQQFLEAVGNIACT